MDQWKKSFAGIQLDDSDVLRFRELYLKIKVASKVDVASSLSIRDVLDYYNSSLTSFMYKSFSAFKSDADPNGMIDDLREFTFSLWNFATFDEQSIGS